MWRKSSFCNGASACVEVDWIKATASNTNGECVEAGLCPHEDQVWVRDSKLGEMSPVLRFAAADWERYLNAVKNIELPLYRGPVVLVGRDDEWRMWHSDDAGVSLAFTGHEVDAFWSGVHAGEFTPEALAQADPGGDRTAPVRDLSGRVA